MLDNSANVAGLPQEIMDQDQQYRSWLRATSKHAKLTGAIVGMTNEGGFSEDAQGAAQASFQPLHVAASQGLVEIGRMIVQKNGSDQVVDSRDGLGCSPLAWASVTNRLDSMLLLLEAGADVDSRDNAGRTPLYACAAFGALDAASLLLMHGADKNAQDARGLTPLHAAAAGNHIEVAKELISSGADLTSRSPVGCTPRHVAARQGHSAMLQLLVNAARLSPEELENAPGKDARRAGQHETAFFSEVRASVSLSGYPSGGQWSV